MVEVTIKIEEEELDDFVSKQLKETFKFVKQCYLGEASIGYDTPEATWKMLKSIKTVLEHYGVNVALPKKTHGKEEKGIYS